jgi:hypothetical protein
MAEQKAAPAERDAPLTRRAEDEIEAWEVKRKAERTGDRREDLSDDAEAGGP